MVTDENCEVFRTEILSLLRINSDLTVIDTFQNAFQVSAYQSYKNAQTKQLLITNSIKLILRITGLISSMASAVVLVAQTLSGLL